MFKARILLIMSLMTISLHMIGCSPRTKWDVHGDFKLRVPLGWAATPWNKVGRMYSRAEASAFIIIEPIASEAEFRGKVSEAVASKKAAYGPERVTEETLDRIGTVKGLGTKIILHDKKGQTIDEELLFKPEGSDVSWILSAGCSSGSPVVWKEYLTTLDTFSKK